MFFLSGFKIHIVNKYFIVIVYCFISFFSNFIIERKNVFVYVTIQFCRFEIKGSGQRFLPPKGEGIEIFFLLAIFYSSRLLHLLLVHLRHDTEHIQLCGSQSVVTARCDSRNIINSQSTNVL